MKAHWHDSTLVALGSVLCWGHLMEPDSHSEFQVLELLLTQLSLQLLLLLPLLLESLPVQLPLLLEQERRLCIQTHVMLLVREQEEVP